MAHKKYMQYMQNEELNISKGTNKNNNKSKTNKGIDTSKLFIKKNTESVKVSNGKEMGTAIFKFIKGLFKLGFTCFKLVFKLIPGGLKVIAKVATDGLNFIGGHLQLWFHGLDGAKQNKVVNGMILTAFGFLVTTGLMFTNIHSVAGNSQDSQMVAEIQAVTASRQIESTQTDNPNSIEVEIDTTELNKPETEVKETKEKDTKVKATPISQKKSLNEYVGDIAFAHVDPMNQNSTVDILSTNEDGEVKRVPSKAYGIGEFTTEKNVKSVAGFLEYVKEIDRDFYEEYFDGADSPGSYPGSTIFDSLWFSATKIEKDKFLLLQSNYIYEKYVKDTVETIKKEYNIDLMTTKASKEFIYSTAYVYGGKGTMMLFEKAGVTPNMSQKEIIERVQQEKLNSIGVYTYKKETGYTDKEREEQRTRIKNETKALLNLI